jgi:hypothetical protein
MPIGGWPAVPVLRVVDEGLQIMLRIGGGREGSRVLVEHVQVEVARALDEGGIALNENRFTGVQFAVLGSSENRTTLLSNRRLGR